MSESWLDAIKGNAPGRMTVAATQPVTGNRLTLTEMIGDVDLVQSGSKRVPSNATADATTARSRTFGPFTGSAPTLASDPGRVCD